MKVRIKFSKTGPMKFVGHLDTMRFFQKAVRRCGLPAAFSGGYSPHMIMSFGHRYRQTTSAASPLCACGTRVVPRSFALPRLRP